MPKTHHCAETQTPVDGTVAVPTEASVVVVGGANMDIIAQTPGAPLAGDSTPGAIGCSPGGVGRNIAENLARLGLPTALLTVLADDTFGRAVLADAAQCGIDTSGCLVLAGGRSPSYLAVHGVQGELALAVNDMDLLNALTPAYLQSQWVRVQQAAFAVLDCNLAAPTIDWLLTRSPSIHWCVDAVSVTKCHKLRLHLHRIHTLKLNALEAQALSGLPVDSIAQAQAAALALCAAGVGQVVLSLGAQGAVWAQGRDVGACAARPTAVVNTAGAGDAMLAGLVYAHLQAWPLPQALPWAMACAELTLGSASATCKDLSVHRVREMLS
jgi:pseudouridine kinase